MNCIICGGSIGTVMIGAGDGRGQKFAHPECYYRRLAARRELKIAHIVEHITYLETNKLITKEVSLSFNKYITEEEF